MIINTGNRTDIPAFYSRWFYNRIKEGYVFARNPYNPLHVTRYMLDPETVDCIAFCTKNPEPMLKGLEHIKQFRQFWAVTITPYDKDIEPFVPSKERVMDSFRTLSKTVGTKNVSWRYDPIFTSEKYSLEFHLKTFAEMAAILEGYTDNCIISFIDLYDKTKRNFLDARKVTKEERLRIGENFVKIGSKHGITIKTCAEGTEMEFLGVDCAGCQTKEVIERAIGLPIKVPKTVQTREDCVCILGSDIGVYNSCGHGCKYCYANFDQKTVLENMENHDPWSPFLIGDAMDGDMIKSAVQESWIQRQIEFLL